MPRGKRKSIELINGKFVITEIERTESGGGRIDIEKEKDDKWHLKLITNKNEKYDFILIHFSDIEIMDAIFIKTELEILAGDNGADGLLHMGGNEMWIKEQSK